MGSATVPVAVYGVSPDTFISLSHTHQCIFFEAKYRRRDGDDCVRDARAPLFGLHGHGYFAAIAASIAAVIFSDSGFSGVPKRLMILPSLLIRNFPKFHFIAPG